MNLSPVHQAAVALLGSLLCLLNAAYGALRGEALIVPTKVKRADDALLFWSTVSASVILGAAGVLVVWSQAVGRVGSRDFAVDLLCLLIAALLGQSTLSSLQRGQTGYFYSSVRRSDNPRKFRWAIGLFAALSSLLVADVVYSLIFQRP